MPAQPRPTAEAPPSTDLSAAASPRSLAEDLRGRTDAELAELLSARPDLLTPVPADLGQLATRAATRPSVARALDHLDLFCLQVLDALLLLPEPAAAAEAAELLGTELAPVQAAVHRLRVLGLLWGPTDSLRVVTTLRQAVPAPAGLGPGLEQLLSGYRLDRLRQLAADAGLAVPPDPTGAARALAIHLSTPAVLEAALATVGPGGREVLDRLVWGPPVGRVGGAYREVSLATARTPVDQLLARGLLVGTDAETVALPREIALHLRGGRVHRELAVEPPALELSEVEPATVERAAAGAAFEVVRHVEDLLDAWALAPPPVLRAGGLGVRELRQAATALDLAEPAVALLVETAHAAGLLGTSDDVDAAWLPTPAYDAWRDDPPARRWTLLVRAWLETGRLASLVGSRDERGRLRNALGPDVERRVAPELRAATLAALAEAPPGSRPAQTSVAAVVRWRLPRRGASLREDLVAATVREAELLGVTGRGVLAPAGRALLSGGDGDDRAADLLAPLLPEPIDHVLLQADLTAVAPGPLVTTLAHELALLADVESRGGATVYRFTEASVRRGFDAGRSAADVHHLLAEHSRTPVPQPLTYLVDDVARRHGRVRVGTASAYVRCDDEAVLARLLAEKGAGQLRLRRLAPTVLAAQSPVETVLERLRALGYAPAGESAAGDIVVRRPDSRRTPSRQRPPRLVLDPPTPGPTLLAAAIRALRAGDRAVSASVRAPAGIGVLREPGEIRSSMADTLATLQEAVRMGAPVWLGYVNAEGSASRRVVEPVKLQGGYLTAYDHRREEVRTFAVHRITGVAPID